MEHVGLKIKDLRLKNKLSMEELGAKIGVTRSQVSLYELGQSSPNVLMLEKLGKALGVPAAYFLETGSPEEYDVKIVKGLLEKTRDELERMRAKLKKAEAENIKLMRKHLGLDE